MRDCFAGLVKFLQKAHLTCLMAPRMREGRHLSGISWARAGVISAARGHSGILLPLHKRMYFLQFQASHLPAAIALFGVGVSPLPCTQVSPLWLSWETAALASAPCACQ
jgi:hypothetical protein